MGEPIRIGDLAHRMIRLAGLVPGRDIEVAITGVRPGEKHTEILSRHPLLPSTHPKISLVTPDWPEPITLFDTIRDLDRLAEAGDRIGLRETLHRLAWQNWQIDEVVDLRGLPEHDVREAR